MNSGQFWSGLMEWMRSARWWGQPWWVVPGVVVAGVTTGVAVAVAAGALNHGWPGADDGVITVEAESGKLSGAVLAPGFDATASGNGNNYIQFGQVGALAAFPTAGPTAPPERVSVVPTKSGSGEGTGHTSQSTNGQTQKNDQSSTGTSGTGESTGGTSSGGSGGGQPSPTPTVQPTAPPATPTPASAPVPTTPAVYVHDFGTSTSAIQSAINAGCGGKQVIFDAITYTVTNTINVCSNVILNGNGATLKLAGGQPAQRKIFMVSGTSNIEIFEFTFDANISSQTYSEFIQAIELWGGRQINIHDNTFQNLVGDGVIAEAETTNCPDHITVNHNIFNGNHTNRNGVSVICVDTMNITNNTFNQMSRADEPGSIDVEPDMAGQHLYNIVISGNTLIGGDGPVSTNSGIRLDNYYNAATSNISISNNVISGSGIWNGIELMAGTGVQIVVQGNQVRNLMGTTEPKFEDTGPDGLSVQRGMTMVATNNTIDTVRQYGILNVKSCLQQSGNTITNAASGAVVEWGPTTCSAGMIPSGGGMVAGAATASATPMACPVLPPAGTVNLTVTIIKAGRYIVASRMMGGLGSADSYWLQIDDGCPVLVGDGGLGKTGWQWVDWQDGQTDSQIEATLTVGQHQVRLIGREGGTKVDTLRLTRVN